MQKIIWKNEKRKVKDLKFFPGNPRTATEKQEADLNTSLTKFDLADPLIVNTDNTVIGGNFRLRLLRKRGVEEIDVRVSNRSLNKQEAKELNLRLNRNKADWDWNLLKDFGEELLTEVGFESGELDQIFGMEIDEEFDVEKELNKVLEEGPRRVKEGDVWQLGNHRLIIGNCVKNENWQRLLGEERFDFMFTDPPYRIGYGIGIRKQKHKSGFKLQRVRTYPSIGITGKDGKSFDIEKSKLKGFGYKQNRIYQEMENKGGVPEFDEWLSIANEFQNPVGTNVMIFENWKNTVELWQAIEKYWKIKNQIIWWLPNRHQGFSAKYKFFSKYDIAPLAGTGKVNNSYEEELEQYLEEHGQKLLDSYEIILYGKKGKSEWDCKKKTPWAKASDHITWTAETGKSSGQSLIFGTKPIQILVPYIKILSPREGIVVDPFGGSGSTLIACEIMKRKCRMIEISEIYGEVILKRWEKFTGQQAVKLYSKK